MIRTLLVDLPFTSLHRPNLALTILQGCLKERGFVCDLRHAKLGFASRIGASLYSKIAEDIPHELLVGDFIFAELLQDKTAIEAWEQFKRATKFQANGAQAIPPDVWTRLPQLRTSATKFLKELALEICHLNYQIVGLNLTFQIAPALALARLLKQYAPELRILVGGGHCEGDMGFILHQSFPWVDFVCRGEGEELIVDLVSILDQFQSAPATGTPCAIPRAISSQKCELQTGSSEFASIPGLVWRNGDTSFANRDRTENIRDLDSLPFPGYEHWLDEIDQSGLSLDRTTLSIPFESSRGCWFGAKMHCTFCGLNGPSLQFRSKSAERVVEELRRISTTGITNADAVDLIMDMRYFETLLPALASEKLGLNIFYELKSNLTRDQVGKLKAAGFVSVQPGIESLSSPLLQLMRKGVKAYQNVRLLKWLMEFGIAAHWNLLYGFPNEDPAEYARMTSIIPWLSHLQPPGGGCVRVLLNRFSPLFDQAAQLGVRNIAPVPAYAIIFGSFCSDPSKLAYYFNFGPRENRTVPHYIAEFQCAVEQWKRDFAKCALVMLNREGELHLFDSRTCAECSDGKLVDNERAVYMACESGATLQTICHEVSLSVEQVQSILAKFVKYKWVIELDHRFLSLAVSLDNVVPDGTPRSLWRPLCLAAYESLAWNLAKQTYCKQEEEILAITSH